MQPWLDDGDVLLYVGDVRDVLAHLPDESVDCVITSPPYWGLRDYGTGSWDGGDPACDHSAAVLTRHGGWDGNNKNPDGSPRESRYAGTAGRVADSCGKCGARRVDRQLGLETTPDLYVQNMVAVFREVRRVLAPHGTCWVNLGDSYNAGTGGRQPTRDVAVAGDVGYWQNAGKMGDKRIDFPGLKIKDLCGVPWRVAFALQADGWWLRSEIIWAKPNPMPESVTDRPTKAHEQVFLLTRSPRYWFDAEAVREPHKPDGRSVTTRTVANGSHGNYQEFGHEEGRERWPNGGRNVRSVWEIATQPFPDAHFATFPEELVRRCLLAGCPTEVCRVCGRPRERIVDVEYEEAGRNNNSLKTKAGGDAAAAMSARPYETRMLKHSSTVGWSDCGHGDYRPGRVLDPFLGSGTTALVARHHGRHAVGVELSEEYARIAAKRLQQLSLGVVA